MAKIKGKGTQLQLSISSSYTTIAQVTRITGPDATVQTYDATALDSSVGREKKVTGFVDSGTVTFSLWLDPTATTLQALTDLITTPVDGSAWKLIFPDGSSTTWSFTGPVKKVTPSVELDRGITADCQLEIDGIVTYPT